MQNTLRTLSLYLANETKEKVTCLQRNVTDIVKKKTITRNCTQNCLAWVILPFVNVVKF